MYMYPMCKASYIVVHDLKLQYTNSYVHLVQSMLMIDLKHNAYATFVSFKYFLYYASINVHCYKLTVATLKRMCIPTFRVWLGS